MSDMRRERLLLEEAALIAAGAWPRGARVERVVLLEEAGSTQDEAKARCEGREGLMVMAFSQTAGRGRLGRAWRHAAGKGVAATLTLDASRFDASEVALRAGVAGLATARQFAGAALGIRWPNDVVLRSDVKRKLAGVLVERQGSVYLAGIGLNVAHEEADWEEGLRERATSLRLLGAEVTVFAVARTLVTEWTRVFAMPREELAAAWQEADVLAGSVQTFEHDGQRVCGVVEGIEPTSEIVVRTADGERVRLPALTTSMVHDAD